ncbi:barstar family protein [Streptomyces sp. NPDC005813]|uniref:barstar family protein n=1 Tax=Streptomyces sp. NPDC005813 TaxID=3155592 RepID=UPI00340FD70A
MRAGEGPPRYLLLSYDTAAALGGTDSQEETWARCADCEGLFDVPPPPTHEVREPPDRASPDEPLYGRQPEPPEPPLRLLGCTPHGALRRALNAGEEDLGHAKLLRLDVHGRTVQTAVEGELTAWMPSAHGPGLVDLTLDPWSERPPSAAREVWDLWWQGRPTTANVWARCGPEGRAFWLRTAAVNRTAGQPDTPAGTTHHLDGRHVTDEHGFFCALGEAVNGPGGYFGRDLDTLDECLRGGWGTAWPFTLVWHDADVARARLRAARSHRDAIPHPGRRPPDFEELLAHLAGRAVDVRPV